MVVLDQMKVEIQNLKGTLDEVTASLDLGTKKKIIVLDLDNTLWGGVIGEDGIEGIELSDHKEGQRYYDFQRQLLEMKNRGILLAINSKNNATDAKKAINEHPSMLIRSKDSVEENIIAYTKFGYINENFCKFTLLANYKLTAELLQKKWL